MVKGVYEYPKKYETLLLAFLITCGLIYLGLVIAGAGNLYLNGSHSLTLSLISRSFFAAAILEIFILIMDTSLSYIFLSIIIKVKNNLSSILNKDNEIFAQRSMSLLTIGKKMVFATVLLWIFACFAIIINIGLKISSDLVSLITAISYLALPCGGWIGIIFQQEIKRLMDHRSDCEGVQTKNSKISNQGSNQTAVTSKNSSRVDPSGSSLGVDLESTSQLQPQS